MCVFSLLNTSLHPGKVTSLDVHLYIAMLYKQYRDEVGGYLSSSCCAVSSAPLFRLLRYGAFLEDIGAEVEVNPDDQYKFLSV